MIKRLLRKWFDNEEWNDDRLQKAELRQTEQQKVIQRHEALIRNIREDFKVLQTRQVNLMNCISHLKANNLFNKGITEETQ